MATATATARIVSNSMTLIGLLLDVYIITSAAKSTRIVKQIAFVLLKSLFAKIFKRKTELHNKRRIPTILFFIITPFPIHHDDYASLLLLVASIPIRSSFLG